MEHPLRCRCGTVSGWVKEPRSANRVVCYCRDCQAFAYFLGQENQILDERGGSDVIQILPKNLSFTQGIEALKPELPLQVEDRGDKGLVLHMQAHLKPFHGSGWDVEAVRGEKYDLTIIPHGNRIEIPEFGTTFVRCGPADKGVGMGRP